jgi:hypothetical protein
MKYIGIATCVVGAAAFLFYQAAKAGLIVGD